MAKLDLNLDLSHLLLNPQEKANAEALSAQRIFEGYLNKCLTAIYPQGMQISGGSIVKLLGRIYAKLDAMADGHLELDPAEVELIKSIFCDVAVKVMPGEVRIFLQYLQKIEQALASAGV